MLGCTKYEITEHNIIKATELHRRTMNLAGLEFYGTILCFQCFSVAELLKKFFSLKEVGNETYGICGKSQEGREYGHPH